MSLFSRHVTLATPGTASQVTVPAASSFSSIVLLNRSTNDVYFTSKASQGTAGDGVPTATGANTFVLPGAIGQCVTVRHEDNENLTLSAIAAVTGSQISVIAQ